MTDLATKIRDRCKDSVENCLDPQAAAQALLAVLEIHCPYMARSPISAKTGKCGLCVGYGEPVEIRNDVFPNHDEPIPMHYHMNVDDPVCAECGDVWEGEHIAYPCPTVEAIGKSLGIEVTSE